MLQNASLLAIVAVDTAENEPSEVGDELQDGSAAALDGHGRLCPDLQANIAGRSLG